MLMGSVVAMVTPMLQDGHIDYAALEQLVDFHVENGTAGIVAVGTTGESATLDIAEHICVVKAVVKHAAGRIPVIAGAGGNSTTEAITLTKMAQDVGANFTLSVVPYYNKPTQEGLYCHFMAVADASNVPVILYNVPGRTIADLKNETVLRLAQHPHINGLKDASLDIQRACELMRDIPKGFALYCGEDAYSLAYILCGGHGVISVTANIAPKLMSQMCDAALAGNIALARQINDKLQNLHKNMFIESNPIPVKWALSRMGKIQSGIRLPLTSLSESAQAIVEQAMKRAEIL